MHRAILAGGLVMAMCCGGCAVSHATGPQGAGREAASLSRIGASQPACASAPADGDSRITIVVDIDETISITDYAGFLGLRKNGSKPYERANEVLTALDQDFRIIYLTARPQWLFSETRAWLTEHGFPAGPVLTTSRVVDVFWPANFKTRSLALLRLRSPEILIGIGDRSTDAAAYAANHMLTLIVNPRKDAAYGEQAILLEDWAAVGEFFRERHDDLCDARALRSRFSVGAGAADPVSVDIGTDLDLSLIYEIPLSVPALLLEPVIKAEMIFEQAEAKRALEQVEIPFGAFLNEAVQAYGECNLLKVRLGMDWDRPVYSVWVARHGKPVRVDREARPGARQRERAILDPMRDSMDARSRAVLTFHQAVEKALAEVTGDICEIELEMDDGLPTYELALMTMGRYIEVEIHAGTGETIEVENETAAP